MVIASISSALNRGQLDFRYVMVGGVLTNTGFHLIWGEPGRMQTAATLILIVVVEARVR
jgi:hypothetical protein